jgi:hypothetical protein
MRCNVITPMQTYHSPYDCSILCPDGKLLEQGDDCKRLTYEQWEKEMRADWESKKTATAESPKPRSKSSPDALAGALGPIPTITWHKWKDENNEV